METRPRRRARAEVGPVITYRSGFFSRYRTIIAVVTAVVCLVVIVFLAVGDPLTSIAEDWGLVDSEGSDGAPISILSEALDSDTVSLSVPSLYQNPELPTGCEVVALTDALLFWGFDLEKTTIADYWLPTSSTDFVYAFMGSPYDSSSNSCMAPCITRTANSYLAAQSSSLVASDLTGMSFTEVLAEVEQGRPAVIWTTIDLQNPGDPYASQWAEGTLYNLYATSHCVVVSGYDLVQGTVTLSDPLEGTIVCDLSLVTQRFEQLGSQAVVIA